MTVLGRTIDDALGEAFDKAATMLDLGYPGGPKLDALAERGDASRHALPVSLLGPDSLDFSFSGLKTALLYAVYGPPVRRGAGPLRPAGGPALSDADKADFAASFQRAAVAAVIRKVERALDRFAFTTLLVGGGVSANRSLRAELNELSGARDLDLRLPPLQYCQDNAAMIAALATDRLAAGEVDDWSLSASPQTALTLTADR